MESIQRRRINLLSIGEHTPLIIADFSDIRALIHSFLDGGSSGLPALYIIEEMLLLLSFDLKSNQEILVWWHFDMMMGTGHGG